MKYEWEETDFIEGRLIRNCQTKALNNKVIVAVDVKSKYSLISLSDGYVIVSSLSKEEMIKVLNNCKYEPTDDDREVTRAIDYLRGVR